jgi:hypothetical protein
MGSRARAISVLCTMALAATAADAAAQDAAMAPTLGGGLLPYTTPPRGYRPSLGITLQPRPQRMAVRFDTTLLCGRDSFDVSARRVVPFADDGVGAVAAQGRGALDEGAAGRLEYPWSVAGNVAAGQASGTLHITGALRRRGRTTPCTAVADRAWQARAGTVPSAPYARPVGGGTYFGTTSQPLVDGLPGAVVVRVTRDGRKVAARWTAAARCDRGPRELLVNFTPPTARSGSRFARTERFTRRFSDALVRYRASFAGRFQANGASGTLRLRARVFDRAGRRLRARCDSGARAWSATAMTPPAPAGATPPAAATVGGPDAAPAPPATSPAARPAVWSMTMTSEPGDPIGRGQTWALGPATHDIVISGDGSAVLFHVFPRAEDLGHFWEGIFAAPVGQPLSVGTWVGGSETDLSQPSIDIAAWGTGCTPSGTFTVEAIEWGPGGLVQTFVVQFEQRCASGLGAALRGRLDFRRT